jgi:NTE family protein
MPDRNSQVLLALSGGGYRAMLFHVGALWRLNELGELSKLTHVSSVSGGSIVAGVLAANWHTLDFSSSGVARGFNQAVVEPLMQLGSHTVDVPAVLAGFLPGLSAARVVEFFYDRYLFHKKALADLPSAPKFIFNATNVQTGAIWSFEKEMMGDLSLDATPTTVTLARAVAASSAFPPFLAPLRMPFRDGKWKPYPQAYDLTRYYDDLSIRVNKIPKEQLDKFRACVVLADGGIGDNLGVATLWRTQGDFYISDGGGTTPVKASPPRDWLFQSIRVMSLIHEQPSQLRAFAAISRFADHDEQRTGTANRVKRGDGAYWNMRWPPESHNDVTFPDLNEEEISRLASIRTALWGLNALTRQRLVNWGYVAANRSLPYLRRLWSLGKNVAFNENSLPFPEAGFGLESARVPRGVLG